MIKRPPEIVATLRFATCNCRVGMKYHALNCPTDPGKPQNVPPWIKPKAKS